MTKYPYYLFFKDDRKEIKCPDCGETSPIQDWQESWVGCEDCGEHTAIRCPKCEHDFDHVWSHGKFRVQSSDES